MEQNNNRPNKVRNKFTNIPNNIMNFPYVKRPNQMIPMMNYDNNNFIPNEEYMNNPQYNYPNMYQIPMQMQMPTNQAKEQNIKNMFKMYNYNQKKPFYQYNPSEYTNFPEYEMSLEDNGQIRNKKFGVPWKRNKKKNFRKANKDLINNENFGDGGHGNNRAVSTENNFIHDQDIPEAYYNDNFNYNHRRKGGRKKATTVAYNYRGRNKKGFYRPPKAEFNEDINDINNENNSDYSNGDNKNNLRAVPNNKNYKSDIDNNSNLSFDNNENINYEEEEDEEEDKNSRDIVIIDDDKSTTQKEILDVKNIKLIERQENINSKSDSNIIKIRSSLLESKIQTKSLKNKIIPELEEMCSEKEIKEREKEKDIDIFEGSGFPFRNNAIKERMVQKYARKENKFLDLNDPKEVRTIDAINKSINYLIDQILDSDKNETKEISENFGITPHEIIIFMIDRYTAIYKTIELLVDNDNTILNNTSLVENIGRMIKSIINFFNIGLEYSDHFHSENINAYIDNLIMPLFEYIKEIIFNESKYEYNLSNKDKDIFLSYFLFIKLKKERQNFEIYYKEIKNNINKEESFEKIELVNDIYNTLKNKDFETFIKILKDNEKCDYITSCFMSLFFREICVDGLMKLSLKHHELTYKQILDYLTFEEIDEAKDFLIWYGITQDKSKRIINDWDTVKITLNNKNKNFDYDKAPQKINKRYVENKLGNKLRKDVVSEKIIFIKNENYKKSENTEKIQDNKIETKAIIKNKSLINPDISKDNDKGKQNTDNSENNNDLTNSTNKKDFGNNKPNNPLDESFLSKGTYNKLFPSSNQKNNINLKLNIINENYNKSEKKITSSSKDGFLKPLSPKKISFEFEKQNTNNINSTSDNNKSLDLFSTPSLSSIEGPYKPFNEQAVEYFCDISSSIVNKIISDRKLDFLYRLKFIVEKYKIKLEMIENYINRRKFFVYQQLKNCCLNKKYTREYFKELVNYKSNLNSENTNENMAFKLDNHDIAINNKFELLTYDDIVYFLIQDFEIMEQKLNNEENEKNKLINHLQINIYTTKDLIKSTKIISTLKLKKKLLKENADGSEFTIIDNNINLDSNNKLSLIIKFIFVDQIIDLDSYIYENQKNISKYAILIPFFDIIKSDPENQQILTKFFTILDIGLGSFIKKDIIFFFIKRDIEQNSDLYKDYLNIQNDFIFNLLNKYGINSNKNIIYVDDNFENDKNAKERIIYLSPIDEFGQCYQEYIKYLNNKAFVELFENNKLFHLNVFNPNEKLISFEKHIFDLDTLIVNYIDIFENDLKQYLIEINCINFFYNNKLCIEVLIGLSICKILLIYYQYISLSFANELFKVPSYNSNNELFILEDNLLNVGSIFRQINLDGYGNFYKECFDLDSNKKKSVLTYFDIFCEIICSYNLISNIDMQNYEYCFRKQYYDYDLDCKNYEIAKNFVDFFNKIVIKFVSNNNLKIKNNNSLELFKKIYDKNKLFLLHNISKIITNNSLSFNEATIYINGLGQFYDGIEKTELNEYNKKLSKKRKRNLLTINIDKDFNNFYNNKKNNQKISKQKNINKNQFNENYQIANNMIEINESIDKSNKSFYSNNNNGDMNDSYIKNFRTLNQYNLEKNS